MGRGILVAGLAMAVGGPLAAQSPAEWSSHERAAVELIEVTRLEEATLASVDVMMEAMVTQNPMLAQFRDVFEDFFHEYVRWDELLPEYVRIYTAAFSEAELRELAAFYHTPVGRKSIRLMPSLMQQGSELGQRQIQPHLPELQRRIEERMRGGSGQAGQAGQEGAAGASGPAGMASPAGGSAHSP